MIHSICSLWGFFCLPSFSLKFDYLDFVGFVLSSLLPLSSSPTFSPHSPIFPNLSKMFPLLLFVAFLSFSFVAAKMHQNPLKSADNMLFLTFHNNSDSLYDVNLITGEEAEQS